MATVKKTPPVDSKGNPKKYEPMFGGPLARGIANLSNRISDNSSKIMEQSRQIELGKERAAKLAELKKKYPAPAYKGTFAPLKPMSLISQPSAPKAAPAARPAAPTARPVAKATPRPAASASAPAAKPMARPSASVARIDTPMVRSVATQEVAPMAKREVKIDTTSKRGNLLQRLGERVKQRQLARASKSVGTPMKSTSSVPSTPTPSAPQREMNATDRLKMALQAKSAPQREMNSTDKLKMALQAQKSQPLSAAAKGMLDKYMSKKYMGGGKMKSYAKGGMIEKEGMKPKGKMDKKKAFMEMIAKLKAKKK